MQHLITLVILLQLAGCALIPGMRGYFDKYERAYQEAQVLPPLKLPAGLHGEKVRNSLDIPPLGSEVIRIRDRDARQLVRPVALLSPGDRDRMRIQSLGARSWLISPQTPSQVWPKLHRFLADNAIAIEHQSPGEGALQTRWLQTSEDNPVTKILADAGVDPVGFHQLQFRVEQALRADFAEVHVRHIYAESPVSSSGSISWQPFSDEPAVEGSLLRLLGQFILSQVVVEEVSLLAQNIEAGPKVTISLAPSGDPLMQLVLDRERTMAMLRASLEKAQIPILEIDTEAMILRVRTDWDLLRKGQPGFWSGVLSGDGPEFRELELHLEHRDDRFYLQVRAKPPQEIAPELAQRILQLIWEFAS